jgi:hypothetical protein
MWPDIDPSFDSPARVVTLQHHPSTIEALASPHQASKG